MAQRSLAFERNRDYKPAAQKEDHQPEVAQDEHREGKRRIACRDILAHMLKNHCECREAAQCIQKCEAMSTFVRSGSGNGGITTLKKSHPITSFNCVKRRV